MESLGSVTLQALVITACGDGVVSPPWGWGPGVWILFTAPQVHVGVTGSTGKRRGKGSGHTGAVSWPVQHSCPGAHGTGGHTHTGAFPERGCPPGLTALLKLGCREMGGVAGPLQRAAQLRPLLSSSQEVGLL